MDGWFNGLRGRIGLMSRYMSLRVAEFNDPNCLIRVIMRKGFVPDIQVQR